MTFPLTDSMSILAVFFTILVAVYHLCARPSLRSFFNYVPPVVFAYFVPTALTTMGVLPENADLYKWIKTYLLPVSLFLFTLSLDLKTIFKLGPKLLWMFLIGTFGVFLGGVVSLSLFKDFLPPEAWQGFSALAGSWIGGGANFVAIGQAVSAPDSILGPMIVVDTVIGNLWMGLLIFLAARKEKVDAWLQADTQAVADVQDRLQTFQKENARVSSYTDLLTIIGLAFVASTAAFSIAQVLPKVGDFIDTGTWRVILITTFGVAASLTPLKNLEGAGASRIGTIALYLLITTIGAQANLKGVIQYPVMILAGALWISIHGALMLLGAKWMRAPLFFLGVGSQANIGAAASAPVVAAAFHPSLAPVGILLAILGYVLGTYVGLLCAYAFKLIAG